MFCIGSINVHKLSSHAFFTLSTSCIFVMDNNGCGMLDGLALISALCACCFARLHPSACYLGFKSGSVPKVCPQNAASNSIHILQLIACVRFCQYCPALVAPLSPCEALSARWGAATPGHCLHMGALRSAPHLASYYLYHYLLRACVDDVAFC